MTGPAGNLDTRWQGQPNGRPVLLLHPHPAHGGSMGTRIIYDLAQAIAEAGYRVVRFDFRGVGKSQGEYDHGNGETDDALAVYDALAAESASPPAVVGFSFGGAVAVALASKRPVRAMVCLATPAKLGDADLDPIGLAPLVGSRATVIHGTNDEHVPLDHAKLLTHALPRGSLHRIEGADHFLTPTHHPQAIATVLTALAE